MEAQSRSQLVKFLINKKILILETNELTRNHISNLLVGLGAKPGLISVAIDFRVAQDQLFQNCPDIIISEYKLVNGNGLALANEFNRVKKVDSIFIVLTDNSMQSIAAAAAEEDVDIYILKPYTSDCFIKMLTKVVVSKMNPSEYTNRINGGKKFMLNQSWDEAIDWFNHAIKNSSTPTLAYFYRSQAELKKLLFEVAEESLKSGLKFNEYHYKCLSALFDLLLERGKFKDAYEVVRRLTSFPLNSKRLSKVIELAVRTAQYSDMDRYYDVYRSVEVKDEELNKHISAALVVSSKMLFQRGEMYKAASYLKKASLSAKDRPNILLEIVTALAFNGFIPNAKDAMEKFPPNSRSGFQYRIAASMIAYCENSRSGEHVRLLKKAVDDGAQEPECFYWLIAFLQASKEEAKANSYLLQAQEQWPDRNDYFQKALKAIPSK